MSNRCGTCTLTSENGTAGSRREGSATFGTKRPQVQILSPRPPFSQLTTSASIHCGPEPAQVGGIWEDRLGAGSKWSVTYGHHPTAYPFLPDEPGRGPLHWSSLGGGDRVWRGGACGASTSSRPSPRQPVGVRRVPVPPEVITVAVRWYLRYGLSYRDVEELLAERGIEVDHVTVYRRVQRFTALFPDAARPLGMPPVTGRFVDETYVKVASRWRYLDRAVDQFAGHRRAPVGTAGHRRRAPVLHPRPAPRAGAGRGDHRQGRSVSAGPGRTHPDRDARDRAVRSGGAGGRETGSLNRNRRHSRRGLALSAG